MAYSMDNAQVGLKTHCSVGFSTSNMSRGQVCERASCYAHANPPRTVPKSYWSWPVANCEESIPTCTVVSSNTDEVHVVEFCLV